MGAITGGAKNIVTDGLVFYIDAANPLSYPGTGTTWTNLSGNGNNGTLTNGPTFDSNNAGSIVFDRIDDFVDLGTNLPLIENNFTVNSWVNTNVLPTNTTAADIQNIIGAPSIVNNADYLSIRAKRIAIWNRSTTGGGAPINWYSSQTDLSINTWFNVVLTCDYGYYKIYLNGNLDSDIPYLGTEWNNLQSRYIGQTQNQRYFSGKISNLQYFNKTLTPSEILQNFNSTRARFGV